ncbi:Bud site selection protein 6 [Actinomortierella ambigua]|nr:Bud site selection protein 6 [Actinomortierella ambigua]
METAEDNHRHSYDANVTTAPSSTMRRRKDQGAMNPIEATVTKLLVATKQLLEGLTLWSVRKLTEEQVSDIFVQLATQFNLASQAFHEVGIDTSGLAHIPDDLRNCLETALGEEPSPASLDQYLPRIKEVIISLLQGLREKQNIYRQQQESKTARLQAQAQAATTVPAPAGGSTIPGSSTSPAVAAAAAAAARARSNGSTHRQPTTPRTPDMDPAGKPLGYGGAPSPSTFNNSFAAKDEPSHAETLASLRKSDTITRRASSRRHSQRFSTLLEQNAPPVPRRQPFNDPNLLSAYPTSHSSTPVGSPLAQSTVYGGQFTPLPSMEAYQPFPATPEASEPVHRRPSEAKSPLSSTPTVAAGATSPTASSAPPLPAVETKSGLGVTLGGSEPKSPGVDVAASQVGSLENVSEAASEPQTSTTSPPAASPLPVTPVIMEPLPQQPADTTLTLFLQVGKSVKKTKFEGELTHSALRMLFMEKFQYNPGQEDFPTIYVKDPQTNIHYELESLADVKSNAFLSLNVDDLENIQRRMDQGFAALAKELHDIKKAQEATESARQKAAAQAASQAAAQAAAAAAAQAAASQGSGSGESVTSPTSSTADGAMSSQLLRSMVHKVMAKSKSTAQGKVALDDLKAQHDEVQNLRRDLGVVRQVYTEFQNDIKSMLGNLAGATSQMRKQLQEAPAASRIFIENGKVKLDQKSESLTNKVEDLQDVVDDMKVTVTQRRGRPSESSLHFVDKQLVDITKEIEELSDFIQTIRPSWKKTWEAELQTIVKEQMFLKEQEALLEDLKEDRASIVQTMGNLTKLLELQSKTGLTKSNSVMFHVPAADESFEGLKTVMEEVRMIAPDSDKRLKAMAQMEKLRQIDLSNRIDEFEEELTSFVGNNKLRKTGGAQEVERQRQQRDQENLRAMFNSEKSSRSSVSGGGAGGADSTIEEVAAEEANTSPNGEQPQEATQDMPEPSPAEGGDGEDAAPKPAAED